MDVNHISKKCFLKNRDNNIGGFLLEFPWIFHPSPFSMYVKRISHASILYGQLICPGQEKQIGNA